MRKCVCAQLHVNALYDRCEHSPGKSAHATSVAELNEQVARLQQTLAKEQASRVELNVRVRELEQDNEELDMAKRYPM